MTSFSGRESRSLSSLLPESMTIGSASVTMSDSVKNLGVKLDCHLTMKKMREKKKEKKQTNSNLYV